MRARFASTVVLVAAVSMPALAQADGTQRDPAAAEALFRTARAAHKAGDHDAECKLFAESQKLDPAGGTAMNLARCEEELGRYASAWQHAREALDIWGPNDKDAPIVRAMLVRLEPRVPHLTVRLAPTAPLSTRVARDGIELDTTLLGFPQPVDPGEHVVRARATSYETTELRVTLREAESIAIEVAPGPFVPPRPAAVRRTRSPSGRRTAGWILAGAGLASVGVGALAGLHAASIKQDKDTTCPGNVCPNQPPTQQAYQDALGYDSQLKTLTLVSDVAFGLGIAGVGIGAYLLLTSRTEGAGETTVIAPTASAGGGGLSFARSF
jgi:hypothetical protein